MAKTTTSKPITGQEAALAANTERAPGIPTTEGADITSAQPNRPAPGKVVSDSQTPYVASSAEYPWYSLDRALPQSVDEAEEQYGIKLYDELHKEASLSGMVKTLKVLALSDGLTIAPSHAKPKLADFAGSKTSQGKGAGYDEALADHLKAKEIADYIRYVLERLGRLDRPIINVLWNALDCSYKAHKLVEATADVIEGGEYGGKVGLAMFKPKPRENYSFVLDGQNTFRGVIAKVPGGSIALRTGLTYDVSQISNAIAPEKLYIFTLDDVDGDPRGVSWFRPCYDPWYRKQQAKVEHLKALMRFAGGMVSVIGPQDEGKNNYTNPVTGKLDTLTNCLVSAASQLANGRATAFPYGSLLHMFGPQGAPGFFESSFERFDREMESCFLLTARGRMESEHGSKADTDTAQDLQDELKVYVRRRVCDTLKSLFFWLVKSSYDVATAEKYCPEPTMQKASRPDFALNATAVAALVTAKKRRTPAQEDYIDTEILGWPSAEGDEEDISQTGEEDTPAGNDNTADAPAKEPAKKPKKKAA